MQAPEQIGAVLLRAQNITRRWGGLVALNQVSLALRQGSVHAVIGTNGAGKSTLINILSGEIAPSDGAVELLGQDVTRWSQPRRARAGLGRSYSATPSIQAFLCSRIAVLPRRRCTKNPGIGGAVQRIA